MLAPAVIGCIQQLVGRLHAANASATAGALGEAIAELSAQRLRWLANAAREPDEAMTRLDLVVDTLIDELTCCIHDLHAIRQPNDALALRVDLFGTALEATRWVRSLMNAEPADPEH